MKNFLKDIFYDVILSIVTKKFGNSLNDDQKEEKADEMIDMLHRENFFTVESTQQIIEKKGFNNFYPTKINGVSVFALVKEGMFHKVKICYFITRKKDSIDKAYLEQIHNELRKQAAGENVFGSPDYKNG